jgi:proline racemase
VNEPRGHADMYGCFVVPPNDSGADLGVVFFHNEGYSTACGHGTIALVTWAVDEGLVSVAEPETPVVVDAPSGRLATVARVEDGRVASVTFMNVPCYVDRLVELEGVPAAIAFGGAFYVHVDAADLGLEVAPSRLPELIAAGRRLKRAVEERWEVVHPLEPELHGIYGVRFSQGELNVTVFADGEVDRSPCGSGTSARLALLHDEGRLGTGEPLRHLSIVGSEFTGRVVDETPAGVVTEVEGSAHLTGRHEFVLDPNDELGEGFLLR